MHFLRNTLITVFSLVTYSLQAQDLYFPPVFGGEWANTDPAELGYCQEQIDSLYTLLEERNTKAFLLLKDGRIVLENYFGTFVQDSIWYWASAGKSLTAFIVGLAQQDGHLSIQDRSADYLGEGWTDCTPDEEDKLTIRHQLTMTSGLDDGVEDPHCTLDTCLQCLAEPGTRWSYHNAPYTRLDGVIEGATGQNLNLYIAQKLTATTGIAGLFIGVDYNNVFFSTPRSMARFGLLVLNGGTWDQTPVLTDTMYFNDMVSSSQDLNPSYGYLWWLNGQPGFMVPGLQIVFPGSLFPAAPSDAFAALGRNGQCLNIAPSQNLIWVRMGNSPGEGEVSVLLNNDIWEAVNALECGTSINDPVLPADEYFSIYPNPVTGDRLTIESKESGSGEFRVEVFQTNGQLMRWADSTTGKIVFEIRGLSEGVYVLKIRRGGGEYIAKFVRL